ncbi:MAG: Multidrug resistance protein MdtE [Holosporales bacterium]
MKKIKVAILFIIFLCLILFVFFHNKKQEKAPPFIRICSPVQEKISQMITIPAVLIADEVVLKPRTKGRLLKINCKEGDIVAKNQVLFTLDDAVFVAQKKQQEANLDKAKAQYENAKKIFDRSAVLLKKGVHTQEQFETFKTNMESLQSDIAFYTAKIEELNETINDAKITAPFSGRIGFISVQEGDYFQDASPVLTSIHKICTLESILPIPEKYYQKLLKLDEKALHTDILNPDGILLKKAQSTFVMDQKIEINTGTLPVKIFIDNPDLTLKSGMSIQAKINLGTFDSEWTLPIKAILQTSKGASVYFYDKETHKVTLKPIEIEAYVDEKALIKRALDKNDAIVLDGHVNIQDDLIVQVMP